MAQPGVHTRSLVETIDIYPTLADLCGITTPNHVEGQSLAALVRDPLAPGRDCARSVNFNKGHTCRSLRTARWRFILWQDKRGETAQTELYDHKADPNENVNVASSHPEVVEQLIAKLEAVYPKRIP